MSLQDFTSFVELLEWRAAVHPQNQAFGYYQPGGLADGALSYGELSAKARAIAAALQAQNLGGQRVLLVYPPGLDFICAFLGCLYAGAIAVPAYPPEPHRLEHTFKRLQAILQDAGTQMILTTAEISATALGLMSKAMPEAARSLQWLATDTLGEAEAGTWQTPALSRDSLAFLQYTSGSTGSPKGVMISHGNLLANEEMIRQAFPHQERDEILACWVPFYHDMGLVGHLLQSLYIGGKTLIMSPIAFLKNPYDWLRLISEQRASSTGAPNFAYDLCVRKVSPAQKQTLDLSDWRLALNGAEPVSHATMERFSRYFADCGFDPATFYPSYGLAEATVFVTGSPRPERGSRLRVDKAALEEHRVEPPTSPQTETTLVSSGISWPGQTLRIVDPDQHEPRPKGRIGEIWLAGPHIAQGYWNRPQETEASFGARLSDGEGPFLRTGDLGFVHQGHLYVTGRIKDLIILRGRNLYPQDIERSIEALRPQFPQIRPGCTVAFSWPEHDEEKLVAVLEVDTEKTGEQSSASADALIQALIETVSEAFGAQLDGIALLPPGALPKTSSGKLMRLACKQAYASGQLLPLRSWKQSRQIAQSQAKPEAAPSQALKTDLTQGQLEQWLSTWLSQETGIAPADIDPEKPFAFYGLDSARSVMLVKALEDKLERSLPPTLLWEHRHLRRLAAHLATHLAGQEQETARTAPQQGRAEPIAIIGMSCRLPGGAETPEAFYRQLLDGLDAIGEIPPDRWDIEAFYDPDPEAPGKMYTRHGGFLADVDRFEPQFFGIAPPEARGMDPQQRLLLETAWEALEQAGQAPDDLRGSQTGVFVGISSIDYTRLHMTSGEPTRIDAYSGTGTAFSVAAGRLSYVLGLQGPNLAIDTACSSSLVAIHLACQSLRQGESELALAGGVNLMLSPETHLYLCRVKALAPGGRCRTFDAAADGYVRGEGAGMVVLKRLSDAQRDRDPILAVILGSAVNQDGSSNGLTAPSGPAQQAVIQQALAQAGVSPAEISYVEAHGTGTPLGDPIEYQSLAQTLTAERLAEHPLLVGSVKTHIGHLEAAAGVAGLLKLVLSLQHKTLPPQLHFHTPNPALMPAAIQIPTQATPWPGTARPRMAGINSFGFSGTNAHLIVAEAPPRNQGAAPLSHPVPEIFSLSATSRPALLALAKKYSGFVTDLQTRAGEPATKPALADICLTAALGRSHFRERLAIVADDLAQLQAGLGAFLLDETHPRMVTGSHAPGQSRKIAFVYSGQGAQWGGMGRQLLAREPVFAETLASCEAIFVPLAGWSLRAALLDEATDWQDTSIVQPALFAIGVALTALWKSWGISPDAVAGHSVGELAAAHAMGALSLRDGLKLAWQRGRIMQQAAGQGKMASVEADAATLEPWLAAYTGRLSLAALNGPQTTVISGESLALQAFCAELKQRDIVHAVLPVDHAFHSPQMEAGKAELLKTIPDITHAPGQIPFFSTVTGSPLDLKAQSIAYWGDNLREPVRLTSAIDALCDAGIDTFVEISPHPVLAKGIFEALHARQHEGSLVISLRRGKDEQLSLRQSLASLYALGLNPNWQPLMQGRKVSLPTYAWQRERYWAEPLTAAPAKLQGQGHQLLGKRLPSALPIYETRIAAQPADGRLPLSLWLELLSAGLAEQGLLAFRLSSFRLKTALRSSKEHTLQLSLIPGRPGAHRPIACTISVQQGPDSWTELLATEALPHENSAAESLSSTDDWQVFPLGMSSRPAEAPLFHALLTAALAKLQELLPSRPDAVWFPIGASALSFGPEAAQETDGELQLAICWNQPSASAAAHALSLDLSIGRAGKAPLLSLRGLEWQALARAELDGSRHDSFQGWLYQTVWEPAPLVKQPLGPVSGSWLIAGAETPASLALEQELTQQGQSWQRIAQADQLHPIAANAACLQGIAYFFAANPLEMRQPLISSKKVLVAHTKLLELVQILARRGLEAPLVLITQGSEEQLNAAAGVAGFARVITLEHPGLQAIRIDLPLHSRPADIRLLAQELRAIPAATLPRELSLRYRGQREAARLQAYSPGSEPDLSARPRPDASYLITGGLGALGLLAAQELLEQGARQLILTSRRPDAAKAEALRAAWPEASIEVIPADIASAEDVGRLFERIAELPPLRGVMHAAGVLDDGVILQQTPARFADVLAPKVRGSLLLHQASAALDLDFFVLFSSVAAALGSPGQANYAAANSFLDALAAERRRRGLAGISLQWGPWQGAGMAAGQAEVLAAQGIRTLPSALGRQLLSALAGAEAPVLGVFSCDWPMLARQPAAGATRLLWQNLLPATTRPRQNRRLFESLSQAPADERGEVLAQQLGRRLETVLGVNPAGPQQRRQPLPAFGFDSLMAVQMKNLLEADLGQSVPISLLLQGSSLEQLCANLLASLRFETAPETRGLEIPAAPPAAEYALSSAQKRYYILEQLEGIKTSYNASGLIEIQGPVNASRLEQAFAAVIARHETLRTSFGFAAGRPVQRIAAKADFRLERFEVPASEVFALAAELIKPFELSRPPLLRAALIACDPRHQYLLLDMHHSISDGKSIGLLIHELAAHYDGRPLPPLPIDYKDYALWQQERLQSQAFADHRRWWLENLSAPLPLLNMPRDYHRPLQQSFQGETIDFALDAPTTQALKALASQTQTTLNTLLFAAYTLLLRYYTGQSDLVVGMIVEGRTHFDLANLIGVFINFLPIRSRLQPGRPFSHWLGEVSEHLRAAIEHQDYPFDALISDLQLQADRSRNPLFDTMLLFHNELDGQPPAAESLKFSDYQALNNHNARLDFLLDIFVRSDGTLSGRLEYNTHLFARETMEIFAGHFQQLIGLILANPAQALESYALFTPEAHASLARQRRLAERSAETPLPVLINASFTAEPLADSLGWWLRRFHLEPQLQFAPYDQIFQELLNPLSLTSTHQGAQVFLLRFEDRLRAHRGPVAEQPSLLEAAYAEWLALLRQRAEQPRQTSFVGVFPVDVTAWDSETVLKLTALYQRLAEDLKDLPGIHALDLRDLPRLYPDLSGKCFDALTDREAHQPFSEGFYALLGLALARRLQAWQKPPFKLIVLDCDQTLWRGICGEDGALGVSVDDDFRGFQAFLKRQREAGVLLALCSRNHPEDVWAVFDQHPDMLLKRAEIVAQRIDWGSKADNLRQLAAELNLGLDSVIFIDDDLPNCLEMMAQCPEVLTLHLPAHSRDFARFFALLWAFDRHQITAEDQQRSALYTQEQARRQAFGGGALQDFLSGLELELSFRAIAPDQIGRVAQLSQRTNQFNLSARRRSEAELTALLSTPGVLGYAVEVADRFGAYGLVGVVIGQVEGDHVWLDTLLLSCRVLGRGIEQGLLSCLKQVLESYGLQALVADFYPTAKNQPVADFLAQGGWLPMGAIADGERYRLESEKMPAVVPHLACYYLSPLPKARQAEPQAHTEPSKTRSARPQAASDLSDKGIQTSWRIHLVAEKSLLHRQQLLPLEYASAAAVLEAVQSRGPKSLYQQNFIEPAGPTELKLAGIIAKVLGLASVSAEASFFELGGDSLKAVTLVARIYQAFEADVPLRTVFEAPTVRGLAAVIDALGNFRSYDQAHRPWLLLNQPQPRKLFCFPPVVGYGFIYGTIARLLKDWAIYGFDFIESRDRLEAYAGILKELQPQGPYTLLGYSSGGNLAFELAKLLESRGESVDKLIFLDAFKKDRLKNITADEIEFFPEWALGKLKDPYLREFFQNVSQREEIAKKMQNFLVYHNQLINQGRVQAEIHLIQSSQYTLYYKSSWSNATTGKYAEYIGSGHHTEMLDSEHLGINIGLIRSILAQP